MQYPYYEFELKTSGCAAELYVNDVPSFTNYDEGGMAVDWPVNQLILKSGVQHFEYRLLPYKGQAHINPKAQAEIKVYVRDVVLNNVARQLVHEEPLVTFADKQLPAFAKKGQFTAQVPYQLQGWAGSVDLSKEDQDSVRTEVLSWNQSLVQIFNTANRTEHARVFADRDADIAKAFYFSPQEMAENKEGVFGSKTKDLITLANNLYKFQLYGNGKVAAVKLPYEPPGFMYNKAIQKDGEQGITMLVLFHRKAKGAPLTVVR